jgi:DNA-binding winged helix-turn-helix (wHTH) protein
MSNPGELTSADAIMFGQFTLIPAERLLKFEDSPVCLGSRALDILTILVEQAGTVVSKRELIARVWQGLTVDDSSLRIHVAALRKALKDGQNGNRYVANIPGRGYSFVAPIVRSGPSRPERASGQTDQAPLSHGLPPRLTQTADRDDAVRDVPTRLVEHGFIAITGGGSTTSGPSSGREPREGTTTSQISPRGKPYLRAAQTLLRAAMDMTDQGIVDQLRALADDYLRRAEKASHVDAEMLFEAG